MGSGPRQGLAGVRTDSQGNLYACVTATVPALTPALTDRITHAYPGLDRSFWWTYADTALEKRLHEGLGHTSESNAVKFVKFAPDGKPLWIAGRKATAAPNPGELYHFWSTAGLVGDDYISGASEWGPIYFYTTDGFYVDAIMNDPATLPPAGPYTFGSETFSGRIAAFPKLGKVYAYEQGGVYAIDGFDSQLKVHGERRLTGTVDLDRSEAIASDASAAPAAAPLQIVPLAGDPAQEATWSAVPASRLTRAGGPLATVQTGYDASTLYARFHVADDTPLQNGADDPSVIFKGGDVVGLDLGPEGERTAPAAGDIRLLAGLLHGQPRLIALKPVSAQARRPQEYTTPASGTKAFDFVGDVPGGKVSFSTDADGHGYTRCSRCPGASWNFSLAPERHFGETSRCCFPAPGARGLQTSSRNELFSGGHVETTMDRRHPDRGVAVSPALGTRRGEINEIGS